MSRSRSTAIACLLTCLAWIVSSCSKDESPTGPGPIGPQTSGLSIVGGDQQTAPARSELPVDPSVVLKDANLAPVAGALVVFSVSGGGGEVSGDSVTTNASGVATVGGWWLGPQVGANTLMAQAPGVSGAEVQFSATARLPRWTFMVYMAADNNLAFAGIDDIDEMEAAGVDPDVHVVVQAEFNPTELEQQNCDASCFNRPNFNTFRYVIDREATAVAGPNGTTIDAGTHNMSDPADLNAFVHWCQTNYKAEHYVLVLWNHGGGYTGLLQDLTDGGRDLMSIGDLPAALDGTDKIDVLDFDMCLMGAYETLAEVGDHADYVVFSEEVVPGPGNPYTALVDGIQASSASGGDVIAKLIADQCHASYDGGRSSTTFSAYKMAGYAAFETELTALAQLLQSNLAALQTPLNTAAKNSQSYTFHEIKDLVHFLDLLRPETSITEVTAQIELLEAAATSADFRVVSNFTNGGGDAADLSHSNGLSIVMPSGESFDQMTDQGSGSFDAYKTLYSGKPWTQFLTAWLQGGSSTTLVDQGDSPIEIYMVWEEEAVGHGIDVDLWVLEPNGNLYIPYYGSVTPNGTMSSDSYDSQTYYESYLTRRYIEPGQYKIYAHLYADPQQLGTDCDVLYRYGASGDFTSVWAPNYPRLTKEHSVDNDPDPTYGEIENGDYTDLQWLAQLTAQRGFAGARPGLQRPPVGAGFGGVAALAARWGGAGRGAAGRGAAMARSGGTQAAGLAGGGPTAAQIRTALRISARRNGTRLAAAATGRRPAPVPAYLRRMSPR